MGMERVGKGSHTLHTVRQLMSDTENWVTIIDAEQYQYPGMQQAIMYCSYIAKLPHSWQRRRIILQNMPM